VVARAKAERPVAGESGLFIEARASRIGLNPHSKALDRVHARRLQNYNGRPATRRGLTRRVIHP
jgi:hypothetical protein